MTGPDGSAVDERLAIGAGPTRTARPEPPCATMQRMTGSRAHVGAAQLGPIQRADTRKEVVERLLALLARGPRAAAATSSCSPSWR